MTDIRKLPKGRNCRICDNRFKPLTFYQWWCCEEHESELISRLAKEARQKRIIQQEKNRKKEAQQERRSIKVRKLALQPLSYFHKQAQSAFNEFIRTRDAGQSCISCGRNTGAKMNAGHYRTVGASKETRYDESNCHLQCEHCNSYLSGNIDEYKPRLIGKIGQAAFDRLMGPHELKKWTREELQELAKHYRQKTRDLIKQQEKAA